MPQKKNTSYGEIETTAVHTQEESISVEEMMLTDATEEAEQTPEKSIVVKTPVEVLKDYSEKTYMDYKKITKTSSPQYLFIKEHMTVCEDGFLRDKHGNIGVALGSYFGEIGAIYEFVLDTGIVLNVVKIEEKADKHTVKGYYHKIDHSIIEFVVDANSKLLKKHMYSNGYIWQGNFNNCPDFNGKIVEIYKINNVDTTTETNTGGYIDVIS